tara:strand:- start:4532 stop:4804 length:273 start_codon:yes stop_codon:yes gene_type:complete
MADIFPLKGIFNADGTVKALGEFVASDTVPISNGGTGKTLLGNLASSDNKLTIVDGNGALINSVTITLNQLNLTIGGSQLNGTVDGGSYS